MTEQEKREKLMEALSEARAARAALAAAGCTALEQGASSLADSIEVELIRLRDPNAEGDVASAP